MDMSRLFSSASKYEEIAVIGRGAYGTVYKARDKQKEGMEGEFVALKHITVQASDEGMPMGMLREIAMLRQLESYDHPNIVKLLDICPGSRNSNETKLFLVFEYMDQDLAQYLDRYPPPGLCPSIIKSLMNQILCGVDFLHEHRIVHRDLKPQNILVSRSGQVKLADFGLARIYSFQMALTSVVVTLWYRAPEVILQGMYSTPIDLWSCGCIFAELHTRQPLFPGNGDGDQLKKIFSVIGLPAQDEWPEDLTLPHASLLSIVSDSPTSLEETVGDIDPEALDLMKSMLQFMPGDRPSARNAVQHPYFTGSSDASDSSLMSVTEEKDCQFTEDSGASTCTTACTQKFTSDSMEGGNTDSPKPKTPQKRAISPCLPEDKENQPYDMLKSVKRSPVLSKGSTSKSSTPSPVGQSKQHNHDHNYV